MHKTWNVRDQTKEVLDEIWQIKSFATAIEMELIRREFNNGETQ